LNVRGLQVADTSGEKGLECWVFDGGRWFHVLGYRRIAGMTRGNA